MRIVLYENTTSYWLNIIPVFYFFMTTEAKPGLAYDTSLQYNHVNDIYLKIQTILHFL